MFHLCPSSVDISPKFFQRISQSPTVFQWYLLIAWVSCSSFPAGLRVLTFHVPTAMFSLPLIFLIFGTPVAYLSPTSRCLTVGAVIVIPGCDRQWKAENLVGFCNWPITRCFIQNDSARLIIEHTTNLPYQATLTGRAIFMNVVCCSRDWRFEG